MPQHVVISDYDPAWPEEFRREAAAIARILGDNLTAIHHIGSTAVPGLAAKPIIDIMPVVRSLGAVDGSRAALESLGYEYLGEFGIPGGAICARAAMSARTRFTCSHRGMRLT